MELHSEIKGLAEIDEFLATLALKVQRNVLRGALRAGAKELETAAKAELASNNSVKTGALRDSIKASVRVKRGMPTATIRAVLEYARDNVSDRMEAAGEEIPDEVFVDEAKNVFRAMIDTLLKEIEE